MAKLPGVRGDRIDLQGYKMPVFISSPIITWLSTGDVVAVPAFCAPCDLEIIGVVGNVITAPGVAGGATLDVGIQGNDDSLIAALPFASNEATGLFDKTSHSLVLSTDINAGDVIRFTANQAAASIAAVAAITLVCVPR